MRSINLLKSAGAVVLIGISAYSTPSAASMLSQPTAPTGRVDLIVEVCRISEVFDDETFGCKWIEQFRFNSIERVPRAQRHETFIEYKVPASMMLTQEEGIYAEFQTSPDKPKFTYRAPDTSKLVTRTVKEEIEINFRAAQEIDGKVKIIFNMRSQEILSWHSIGSAKNGDPIELPDVITTERMGTVDLLLGKSEGVIRGGFALNVVRVR